MRNRFRVACALCCAALLCGALPVAAEGNSLFVFPYEGFRFEAPEDARVLTQHNLGEHAAFLAELGTDQAAMLDGMRSAGVVLEVFPVQGGQIELALTSAEGIASGSSPRISREERDALLEAYAGMPRYQEVAFSAQQPDWLRMVFSTQQGGLPVFTVRYITVAHGQQFVLSSVLIGRMPEDADDALVLDIIGRISFLSAQATPEPSPTPEPTPQPTATPKPTPGVAERLSQELGEDVYLSVDALPAWTEQATLTVTGEATPRSTVRVIVDGSALGKGTAGSDGRFSVAGTLPQSGTFAITVQATTRDGNAASETYSVRMEAPKLWIRITEPTEPLRRKEAAVKGQTEPGTKIDIDGEGASGHVRADSNGDFSFRVQLTREGVYTYDLTLSLKGYESYETSYSVVREFTEQEALRAFRQALVPVDYNRVLRDPESFEGKRAGFRSRVVAIGDLDGVPCVLLQTRVQSGKWDQPVWALCDEAPTYAVGEVFTAYLQYSGTLMPYIDGEGATSDIPVAHLRFVAK